MYVTTGFLVSHIPSIVEQNGRQWNSSYMRLSCTEKVAGSSEPLSDPQWWDVLSPAPATALIMMPHPVTSQTFLPTAIQGSLLWGRAAGTFCSKRQQARAGSNLKSYLFIWIFKKYIKFFPATRHIFFIFPHTLYCEYLYICMYVCMYICIYVCIYVCMYA